MKSEILLINSTDLFKEKESSIKAYNVPTHLLLIGSEILKHLDLEVRIYDLKKDKIPPLKDYSLSSYIKIYKTLETLLEKTLNHNTKYIGISAYGNQDYLLALLIGKILKEINSDLMIIVGGFAPTFSSEDFSFINAPFDYIIKGESDCSLIALLRNLKRQEGELEKWEKTPTIIESPFIHDLDNLSPIDWTLIDISWIPRDTPIYVPYYSSRGCPYQCSYCCKFSNIQKRKWRGLKPSRVVDELLSIESTFGDRVFEIYFYDPLWGLKNEWREQILSKLIDLNFTPKLWAEMRVDKLNLETINSVAKLNMTLNFGVESGSPTMLRIMNKTQNPQEYLRMMKKIKNKCEENQVYWKSNILLGHPGETSETLKETFTYFDNLTNDSQYGYIHFNIFKFYPGAPVYINREIIKEKYGTKFPNPYWYKIPIPHENVFFTNPSSTLSHQQLLMTAVDFGFNLAYKCAKNFINIPEKAPMNFIQFFNKVKYLKQIGTDLKSLYLNQSILSGDQQMEIAKRFWNSILNYNFPQMEELNAINTF